jgi:xanthine dehydrogenase accessory factor
MEDDIPGTALQWVRSGQRAALATVVETWGSAPRRPGAQMAVSGSGAIAGSMSGGCVEAAVVTEALDALADGRPRLLTYGVSDGDAFAVGLACGGTIRVLVEPVGPDPGLPEAMLADLVAARAARRALALCTDLASWDRALTAPPGDGPLAERFRRGQSGVDDGVFTALHLPAPRLVVIGAVHIAQALAPMARIAGFAPIVIDPRPAFATTARFPDAQVIADWPPEALPALDAHTGLVALTHDPKIDDPALRAALASPAFYIGALGSRRTHAARLERLMGAGDAARIHGPIGLDIGAATPAEIAVAILAQIVAARRRPDA